ncbi:MAG: hypothetical protein IPN71_18635 [Fibrobacteres bacterium]|nr:hypothetical protein [Fibrobacterota bacterium]
MKEFIRKKLKNSDLVILNKIVSLGSQIFRGELEWIYSSAHSNGPLVQGESIDFVGTPGHWGNPTLDPYSRALVFIGYIHHSEKLYQDSWTSFLPILSVDGVDYSLIPWRVEGDSPVPEDKRVHSPAALHVKPWMTVFKYEYIDQLIKEIQAE